MLVKYKCPKTGAYLSGDDGGFDMRRVRWAEEDGFLVGRVAGPGDEPWALRTLLDGRSRRDAERMIEMSFSVAAAAWRANHGYAA